MAAAVTQRAPSRPACSECAGGGEINGLPCRVCHGSGRQAAAQLAGWRAAARRWSLAVAGSAATAAGRAVRWSATLPGLAGAAAVSFGVAMVAHGVWHALPETGVGLLAGGIFALAADRHLQGP